MTKSGAPLPDRHLGLPLPLPVRVPEGAGSNSSESPSLPAITSHELLRGGREIRIHHGEDTYLLRVTRNGKLILTK